MLDMARGHEALELRDAQEHALKQLMDRLSDNAYDTTTITLPDDADCPITFG
ncbi:type III secretion protein [Pseudomonas sp. S35]|uniref:type III secretion protein n=1 Tax=Pseudomonas sp. S35 TaxID=1573719 RepID=UPI00135B0C94|nr:type III secretion protein [Pseudomonas sp. S35]